MNGRPRNTTDRTRLPQYFVRLDKICDAFESAWRAGNEPRIEDFIAEVDEKYHVDLLKELLMAEWDLRDQNGKPIEAETYRERFPHHKILVAELYEKWHGDGRSTGRGPHVDTSRRVGWADESQALAIRCPHCHHLNQLRPDSSFSAVTCPACESQFSLTDCAAVNKHSTGASSVGHFELVEQLGVGAFGTVWKAHDRKLDRTVAVKIPRKGQLEPDEVEIFLREARTAAQLRHPNILSVYEVGRDGETVFIVSNFVDGVTLADWLCTERMTAREAAQLCAKIADALHYAHEAGVIHRDLKPHNIMLDAKNEPILMDFGLARRDTGEVTMTLDGHVLGTPAYMSPEQARGEAHHADQRTDVYSLGAVLFELLTGERPFRGRARMIIHQVIYEDAPSPRKFNASLPLDLETICLKCLEKEPGKRFECARDVADELRRYLAGKPIHARRVTRIERAWRWCRRNRLASALAAAVMLSLIFGTLLASWQAVVANQHQRRAQQQHYQALMNLIQLDWEKNELGRVRTSLVEAAAYPDRGYEYLYWQRQLHRSLKTFRGHLDRVADVAVSPDGRLLATASNDETVRIWEIQSGSVLRTLRGHTSWVRSVSFFPDGKRVLTSADDLTARVWDVDTGRECLVLHGHTCCRLFSALSSDGRRIVTASYDGLVKIWDAGSGDVLQTIDVGYAIWGVAISPDGKRVVIGEESHREKWGNAWLLDLEGKRPPVKLSHAGKVWTFEFSRNGKWLATASGDGTAGIWDARTGEKIDTLRAHKAGVSSIGFSPNSKRIVTGGHGGTVTVWDWNGETSKEMFHVAGHQHFVWATVFLPDNQTLITGGSDGTAKLWDTTAPEPRVLRHPGGVRGIAFARNDQFLISGCDDGAVRLWDGTTGELAKVIPAHRSAVASVAVDPRGEWIASGSEDGTARVWDVATGQARFDRPLTHDAAVTSVSVSSDGKWIATGSRDRTVKIWNTATGMLVRTLAGHSSDVKSVVFSPDARQIVASGDDTTVWNATTGDREYELDWPGPYYAEECLAISKELLVIGGRDEWQRPKADVWDWKDRRLRFTLRGHRRSFFSGGFSPDGRRIVTASMDQTAKLWDSSSGRELLTLTGHTDQVISAVFSSDGLRVATASLDGTVRIWHAASAAEAARWMKQDEAAREQLARLKGEQLATDQRQHALLRQDAGAIRRWLILGPIKLTSEQPETALDEPLIAEAQIAPFPHQPVSIAHRTIHWQGIQLDDFQFDFSSIFGPGVGNAVAYAVCYIESDTARQGLRLVAGNRGLAKFYLNGREIYKRTVDAAQPFGKDAIPHLQLDRGRNVLVCKYVHLGGAWPGSVRFTDEEGNPVKGIE